MKLPPLSGQETRERLVASYFREAVARGQSVNLSQLEAMVVSDLQLVDAARRDGDLGGKRLPTTPAIPRPDRPDPIAVAEAKHNKKLNKGLETDPGKAIRSRPRILHQNPMLVSEQWGYAVARIARITESAGGSSTFTGAVANAELPELAKEYATLWAHFLQRMAPPPSNGKRDFNPFRFLSDKDASRMFMRKVFDICDKSTGVLGSWYVQ